MSEPDSAPLPAIALEEATPPPPEALQFQRAEYAGAGPACAYCKSAAGPSYYHVGQSVACPACTGRLRLLQTRPSRPLLVRAVLYGLGAAVAGSVIFALISLTGFQFSIVAILVGVMVGKAICRATGGRTSRACQVLAVVLTYGAITTSYLPMMISTVVKQGHAKRDAKKRAQPAAKAPQIRQMNVGQAAVGLVVGTAVLVGFSLLLPFMILAHSPVSGLINLVIIGIGLRQAWRLTAPFKTPILGPYTAAGATSVESS